MIVHLSYMFLSHVFIVVIIVLVLWIMVPYNNRFVLEVI